ncbi:MAG: rhamnulokinase [Burkholderiaceae bacterium]|nr:rhamnulokinase [Microbacteriaceae bacterium]
MTALTVAAVDLGAESGRVAAARFDGTRLHVDVHHRFVNRAITTDGWLRWQTDALWAEISSGLTSLARRTPIASVGVDTWGIDYGYYDEADALLEQPTAYRDSHRVDVFERTVREQGAGRLYDATGIQLMEINSLFGMLADARLRPDVLARARHIRLMPDVFHHRLSGSTATEFTAASTTGMLDMATGTWAMGLLDALGLPTSILPEVAPAGTDVGGVIGELASAGLRGTRVILPPAHDTASAVLAIPNAGSDTLFISSGTWSLVGVVLDNPIITPASRRANLTNEGGYGGTVRFLRNVTGLWVLQECRAQWLREGTEVGYARLVELAGEATPVASVLNLNETVFLAPGDMPARVRASCVANGMPVPDTMGEVARLVIDSLALSYRLAADDIEAVTGVPIRSIAVVGGGGENALLQQATAPATGLPVVCWAREATSLGNAAAQLRTLGELDSIHQIWEVVAASTQTRRFLPQPSGRWHDAAITLRALERAESRRRGLEDLPTSLPAGGPGIDAGATLETGRTHSEHR